jgi:N-acyl-D-aspartate/D-glutamate deacylase
MQSLSQLSYNSAKPLGDMGLKAMQERGRMQVGKIADITIFDPEKVADVATYAKGAQPSVGIPYVLVNGTIVVKDSKVLKDVNPGQPLRFERETKSRFEPISVDSWKHLYSVSSVEFGGTEPFGQHGLDCC